MHQKLTTAGILPAGFQPVAVGNLTAPSIYEVVMGAVTVSVHQTPDSVYAHFLTVGDNASSIFDITSLYQASAITTLQKLLVVAFCQHYTLSTNNDPGACSWQNETLGLKQFDRDIESIIPKALLEADLTTFVYGEGQHQGVYYFVLEEARHCDASFDDVQLTAGQPTFCLVELDVSMPHSSDLGTDATVYLSATPLLDAQQRDRLIKEYRTHYVEKCLPTLKHLFDHFPDETLSLLGKSLSQANALPFVEQLAEYATDWWYFATQAALANLCPNLVTLNIETDSECDDAGNYSAFVSNVIFIGVDGRQYNFAMYTDSFKQDPDLFNEQGELAGETYQNAVAVLGPDFTSNGVFKLVEMLTLLMMQWSIPGDDIRPRPNQAA